MLLLVVFVFMYHESKAGIPREDNEWYASNTDSCKLRAYDKPEYHSHNQGGKTLPDRGEGDACEPIHFLRIVAQAGCQRSSTVFFFVKVFD
jgi:hypothetical protein